MTTKKLNLNEMFYVPVQRRADTASQSISADDVSRVLRCASLPVIRMFESAVVSLNWLADMDAELASCVFMLILAVGLLWGTIE